jgi:hypothetical protein
MNYSVPLPEMQPTILKIRKFQLVLLGGLGQNKAILFG